MKNIKMLVGAVVISVFTFSMAGCKMIQKTPEAIKNTVVTKINNENVTLAQVDEKNPQIVQYLESKRKDKGENYTLSEEESEQLLNARKQLLDTIVTQKVLFEKAKSLDLVPADEELNKEVDSQLENQKKQFPSEEEYKKQLEVSKMTEEKVKEMIKESIISQKTVDYIFKDIKVSDEDVKTYYDENKDKYSKKPGAKLAHILVKTEDEAKDIKKQLDGGAKFEDLAKKYGTDGTKDKGGDLGFVEYDTQQMDKDFMEGAKKLKEGEVSNPVKSQFGFHLIKATGLKTDTEVTPFEDVKESVKEELTNKQKDEKFKSTMEEWKKELKVEVKEDELKSVY